MYKHWGQREQNEGCEKDGMGAKVDDVTKERCYFVVWWQTSMGDDKGIKKDR
jgi:hypothetical protein